MNPALDNCPLCSAKLTVFARKVVEKGAVVVDGPVCQCPNRNCAASHIEANGDMIENSKASFHGECLKRGKLKARR